MTDAVNSAVERKYSRDSAIIAMRSKALSKLKKALGSLSGDEHHDSELRKLLEDALAERQVQKGPKENIGRPTARCVSDGIEYRFYFSEIGDVSFFVTSSESRSISVKINTLHPFGKFLNDSGRLNDTAVMGLLAAWAHFELEQANSKLLRRTQEARADWSRVVRRLFGPEGRFKVE